MSATEVETKQKASTKAFVAVAILVCLILAGAVSFYASGSPDGLNKVAADHGLAAEEQESATADSPLAGYATKDVDNERLSGGLAGIIGVGVVLLIAGGTTYLIRRRSSTDES
jgi:hypothetical protein